MYVKRPAFVAEGALSSFKYIFFKPQEHLSGGVHFCVKFDNPPFCLSF